MRILVCLDATPGAAVVLDTALDLARRTGAKLLLLRSVALPSHVDQEALVRSDATVIEILTESARCDLVAFSMAVPSSLLDGIDVQIGVPWESICREATERDCDVVVIGSHHHSALSRLFGTTAKVLDHCERSVVLARPTLARRQIARDEVERVSRTGADRFGGPRHCHGFPAQPERDHVVVVR